MIYACSNTERCECETINQNSYNMAMRKATRGWEADIAAYGLVEANQMSNAKMIRLLEQDRKSYDRMYNQR